MTQAFKFLKYCCEQSGEDEQSLLSTVQLVDYFLCSSKFLTDFLDHLETTWQMGMPGRLGYVTGIADLLDFDDLIRLPDQYCKIFPLQKST